MLSHREISQLVKSGENPADTVNNLVDAALSKGGYDNITCIVLDLLKERTVIEAQDAED